MILKHVPLLRNSLFFCLPVFLALSSGAQALDIQFSTEEGYPAEASPLEGTPAKAPVWHVSPGDGFLVTGAEKKASANQATETGVAILTVPIPLVAGQTSTISVDFEFAGVDVEGEAPEGGIHLPGLSISSSSHSFFQGFFHVLFGHFPWSDADYTVQLNPGGQIVSFGSGDLGIDGVSDLSDRLRFVLKITKGVGREAWNFEVNLLNVTADMTVASLSASLDALPKEFRDSSEIFLNLTRGNGPGNRGSTSITFFSVKVE